MVVRSMFTHGSRCVIMRQAVSAEMNAGFGVKPAGLLDARPQRAQRAELGDGQELVGVGGEPEFDHAARGIERDAGAFQRAQISDRDREHIGQLLRLRAAGVVDDAAVGGGERAREALPSPASRHARRSAASDRDRGSAACRSGVCAPMASWPKRMLTAPGAWPRPSPAPRHDRRRPGSARRSAIRWRWRRDARLRARARWIAASPGRP